MARIIAVSIANAAPVKSGNLRHCVTFLRDAGASGTVYLPAEPGALQILHKELGAYLERSSKRPAASKPAASQESDDDL